MNLRLNNKRTNPLLKRANVNAKGWCRIVNWTGSLSSSEWIVTSRPSKVTSGRRKWHRAPKVAKVAASTRFPSWFKMWTSALTSHAFSSQSMQRLSRSTQRESNKWGMLTSQMRNLKFNNTFDAPFYKPINFYAKFPKPSSLEVFSCHRRHLHIDK